jgi:preprotein translocase subunit SecD
MALGRSKPWVVAIALVSLAGCTATVLGQAGSAASVTAVPATPGTYGHRHFMFRGVIEEVTASRPLSPSAPPISLAQRQTSDPQQQQVLAALTCTPRQPDPIADQDDPTKPLITCDQQGKTKFILGPSFLDGNQITNTTAGQGPNGADYVVNLTFKSAGSKMWATYTSANVGKQAAFVLDSQVVSAPTVQQAILGGNTQISGNFTQQQAEQLANTLSGR